MEYRTAWQEELRVLRAENSDAFSTVHPERTDLQLADQVLAGDHTAFEQIFDRHKRLVAQTASRYFSQPHHIEEIVQTTFSKAFFELKGFRGGHGLSLAGWLAAIARNACLDTLRIQKRRPEHLIGDFRDNGEEPEFELPSPNTGNEERLIDRDLAEKLLNSLDADDRALLQMLYIDDITVNEAAAFFGWSPSKVKIRSWRARNRLRRIVRKFM